MVSMKDIAKQCNVSVASVSKALNGYSDISEETRQLILKTASEMGYHPNSSARSLKTKRSHNLGVLFVDEAMSGLTHDYFNHVLESFKRTAESRGYDITFTSGNLSGQHISYYDHWSRRSCNCLHRLLYRRSTTAGAIRNSGGYDRPCIRWKNCCCFQQHSGNGRSCHLCSATGAQKNCLYSRRRFFCYTKSSGKLLQNASEKTYRCTR